MPVRPAGTAPQGAVFYAFLRHSVLDDGIPCVTAVKYPLERLPMIPVPPFCMIITMAESYLPLVVSNVFKGIDRSLVGIRQGM